jgi:hypothetical protein
MGYSVKPKNDGLRGHLRQSKKSKESLLTVLPCRYILTGTVKSLGNNSLIANLPDNAGELRSREARTAPNERHTSPALSGFLCAEHRRVGV